MKLREDLGIGPVGAINLIKQSLTVLSIVIIMQSCVMHKSDLKLNIINLSKDNVYLGVIADCDSCDIQRDVRLYCSNMGSKPSMLTLIKANDSLHLETKLVFNTEKIYAINADSLDVYCRNKLGNNIIGKPWVKVLSGDVDIKTKTCTILVK